MELEVGVVELTDLVDGRGGTARGHHSKMALVFLACCLFLMLASQCDLMSSMAFFLLRLWNMFSPIKDS